MVPLIPAARKLVALSLCILLTAGAWVPLVTTDNEDSTARNDPAWEVMTTGTRSNGNGTKDNPFMIYTIEDLQAMKVNLTAHYALANDIDASVTEEWNSGAGFEPVGPDWDIHFTGSLDGRNFTISGLYINRPSTDLVGLFGYVDSGGSVSNVGVVNVDIKGRYDVGGLVGYIGSGSVSNCSATGSVSGDSGVGGLLGMNYDSVVTACCTCAMRA